MAKDAIHCSLEVVLPQSGELGLTVAFASFSCGLVSHHQLDWISWFENQGKLLVSVSNCQQPDLFMNQLKSVGAG
jgi:hypothetical protein